MFPKSFITSCDGHLLVLYPALDTVSHTKLAHAQKCFPKPSALAVLNILITTRIKFAGRKNGCANKPRFQGADIFISFAIPYNGENLHLGVWRDVILWGIWTLGDKNRTFVQRHTNDRQLLELSATGPASVSPNPYPPQGDTTAEMGDSWNAATLPGNSSV